METLQIKTTNWIEYNSSKRWIKKLRSKNEDKEITPKTLEAMQTWFTQFLRFHNKTPDELIEEALVDIENVQDSLDDFYRAKKNEIDRNSCITGIYGVLRGFYRHNRINVQDIVAPKFSVRKIKKTDANFPLFQLISYEKDGQIVKQPVLNRDLLREFYSHLTHRDQCIMLCLLSTGLDLQDLLKITVGDVKAQINQDRIFLNGNRNKTFTEYSDFCTKEATHRLKEYVKKERKDAEDNQPVFVTSVAGRKSQFKFIYQRSWTSEDTLPKASIISPRDVAKAFRNAQKAMGVSLQKATQSPLRPKRFKKIFRTACSHAGLDQDITNILLGHKGKNQSQNYEEENREMLEYYYELVEPKISLFTDETRNITTENELRQELLQLKQQKELDYKKQKRLEEMIISTRNKTSVEPDEVTKNLIIKVLKEKKII